MTSTITIDAHLADTKQVVIKRTNKANNFADAVEEHILQDGESVSLSIYDDYVIEVREVER